MKKSVEKIRRISTFYGDMLKILAYLGFFYSGGIWYALNESVPLLFHFLSGSASGFLNASMVASNWGSAVECS